MRAERRLQVRELGFTMVELMIVMAIVVTLVSIAIPQYQKAIVRSKESVLKNNLFTIRQVIDEYTYDKKKAPQSLQDLVAAGYLRDIPIDPMTNSNQDWHVVMEDALQAVDQTEPGIYDVKSGSDKTGLDGTAYADY
jgi:general secretion pathway protein G